MDIQIGAPVLAAIFQIEILGKEKAVASQVSESS